MDIENKYEQELIFQIELKNKTKLINQKKIIKMARENLKKMMMSKMDGKNGDC